MSSLILKRAKVVHNNAVNQNYLINGNFDIWQRGSTFYDSQYSADRWYFSSYGGNQAQRIFGNIGLSDTQNCIRLKTLSDDSFLSITQVIPTTITSELRNKTSTLSFYARSPSGDFSNNWSGPIYAEVFYSPDIDDITSNKTLIAESLFSGALTGTNNWQFYSSTFSVPSNASTLSVVIRPSGNLSDSSIVDIAKIKLEQGSLATPISKTIDDNTFYTCRRFYQTMNASLKAGAASSSSAKKQFGYSTSLPVNPRTSNPQIIISDTSTSLSNISANINNNNYLNISAQATSSHSQLSANIIIDDELAVGRPASKIDYVDIDRVSGSIYLDWNTPSYTEENITDYVVYYGITPNNLNNIISFADTTGSLTGLSDSAPYYIKIKTINPFGESELSNLFESAPIYTVPSAVLSLTGTWGFNTSYLTWDIPSSDGGSAISGYRIDRSMYSDFRSGNYTSTHYVPISPTSFSVARFSSEINATSDYHFRVSAINLAGTGTPSTITLPKTTSTAPTNLQTSVGTSQTVVVNYGPPTGNGGATITQMQLQYSTTSNFSSSNQTKNVTANYQPITVNGLTNNTTYYFRLRALNSEGYGFYTDTFSAVPFRTPTVPGSITNLTASWVDNDTVFLTWSAPADNGGVPIINYTLYSSTGSDFATNLLSPINTTNSITSIVFDVPTTGSNSNFYFRGKANNSVGSSASYSTSSTLAKQAPSAPVLLTATRGDANVQLSWQVPTTSKGSAVTGYQVDYSTSSSFTSSTTLSATGQTLTVGSLTNDVNYYFRVKAFNTVGGGSYSNTLSQTPKDSKSPPGAPYILSVATIPLIGDGSYLSENKPSLSSDPSFSIPNTIARVPITSPYSGGAIYGSNPYSWDSDIRTAAIHAGALTPSETGIVYLYTMGNLSYYGSTTSNGITSTYLGSNNTPLSYKVVGSNLRCTGIHSFASNSYERYIRHQWLAPSNHGGSTITGYEIQASTSSDFSEDLNVFTEPGNTTWGANCAVLSSGNRRYSRIRAANTGGFSAWSNTYISENITIPYMPIFSVSNLSNTGIQVVWSGGATAESRGYDNVEDMQYLFRVYNSGGSFSPTLKSSTWFTGVGIALTGQVASTPGSYRCSLVARNSKLASLGSWKYVSVPNAASNTPKTLSWLFTSNLQCCGSKYTTQIVNGKIIYYPNVSALKDSSYDTTYSTYRSSLSDSYYIQADFGQNVNINSVIIGSHRIYSPISYLNPHTLQGSIDGTTWTDIGNIGALFGLTDRKQTKQIYLSSNNYRYIRILGSTNHTFIDISEFYFN